MLQQFLFRRKVAPLKIACVVNEDIRVAGLLPDLGERIGYGVSVREVQLDDDALAALFPDRCLQSGGVPGIASGQDGEKAFLCKFLGDGSAYAPAHSDGQITVVEVCAVD